MRVKATGYSSSWSNTILDCRLSLCRFCTLSIFSFPSYSSLSRSESFRSSIKVKIPNTPNAPKTAAILRYPKTLAFPLPTSSALWYFLDVVFSFYTSMVSSTTSSKLCLYELSLNSFSLKLICLRAIHSCFFLSFSLRFLIS